MAFGLPHMPKIEDMVNKPLHYTVNGVEAIDVLRAKLTPEEFRGFCKGNALKYLMRANYKGHEEQDIAKAVFYLKEIDDASTTDRVDEVEVREADRDPPF